MKTLHTAFAATLIAASLALPVADVQASSVRQQSVETLAKSSGLIFEGNVVGIRAEAAGKKVYTYVTFEVNDVLRGSLQKDTIELRYLGGSANGVSMNVSDMNLPSYGEHGVYFVEDLNGNTIHPLRGWGQGHFIVKQGSGGPRMYNSLGKAITEVSASKAVTTTSSLKLNSHSAAGVSSDTGAKQVLDLNSFKDLVRGL